MPPSSIQNTIVPKDGKFHIDPVNPMRQLRYLEPWYPTGVSQKNILWGGNTAKVALLVDKTVLKYVWDKDDARAKKCLDVENDILLMLGNHKRIVKYLGRDDRGLLFELAANGDVRRYLGSHNSSEITERMRRKWAEQAAEALAFVHGKGVIHCDIHPNNLLLDKELDIQLCDFAGSLCGALKLDGGAMESPRFFLPRDILATPDTKSDLFALGSTIYFIMSDHEPYDSLTEEEVAAYYSNMKFPDVQSFPCGQVIAGCWKGEFKSAQDVVKAIRGDVIIGTN
ncbi:hypothetical protein FKW77_001664 [Venturia effusa]|uniref:Protein kinase domain-containing protein n=1 Tax=Venturia effusa TaxID=50376 RepID=A0A517L6P3_9PEZI|nr:hypothetical protein FKW77_001664 [Venturia effusa]